MTQLRPLLTRVSNGSADIISSRFQGVFRRHCDNNPAEFAAFFESVNTHFAVVLADIYHANPKIIPIMAYCRMLSTGD